METAHILYASAAQQIANGFMNTPIVMNHYPTPEHQRAAEVVVEFFTAIPEIETVCLNLTTPL